jgi:hypothetical protein
MKNGHYTPGKDSEKEIISRIQSSRAQRNNEPTTQDSEESMGDDGDDEDTSVVSNDPL